MSEELSSPEQVRAALAAHQQATKRYQTGASGFQKGDQPTLTYAPEIEAAMLGILWRQPERLAVIKRELDPTVHFVQPALRYLLEAIDLAYRELGAVDFA